MNYGLHSEEVQEVLDFAKAGPLLQPLGAPPASVAVVRDWEVAKRMAWEDRYGQDEFLWTDIREREISKVKGKSYRIAGFDGIKARLTNSLTPLAAQLKRRMDDGYLALLDDVTADLVNCAYARAIESTSNAFFERIFMIYQAGGWPCGWSGDYPRGEIVAYWPRNE